MFEEELMVEEVGSNDLGVGRLVWIGLLLLRGVLGGVEGRVPVRCRGGDVGWGVGGFVDGST